MALEEVSAPVLPRISHYIIILFPIYTLMHVQSNYASISKFIPHLTYICLHTQVYIHSSPHDYRFSDPENDCVCGRVGVLVHVGSAPYTLAAHRSYHKNSDWPYAAPQRGCWEWWAHPQVVHVRELQSYFVHSKTSTATRISASISVCLSVSVCYIGNTMTLFPSDSFLPPWTPQVFATLAKKEKSDSNRTLALYLIICSYLDILSKFRCSSFLPYHHSLVWFVVYPRIIRICWICLYM